MTEANVSNIYNLDSDTQMKVYFFVSCKALQTRGKKSKERRERMGGKLSFELEEKKAFILEACTSRERKGNTKLDKSGPQGTRKPLTSTMHW